MISARVKARRALPAPARLVLLATLALGCAPKETWSGDQPMPDFAEFETEVYPVLLRDCAFSECHGSEHRFFQVFGPGRTRLAMGAMPTDPATREEIQRSYDRARSMLAGFDDVEQSLLVRKPLEASAGGQSHKGLDAMGRNVYRYRGEPSHARIVHWAQTARRNTLLSAAGAGGTGMTGAAGQAGGP